MERQRERLSGRRDDLRSALPDQSSAWAVRPRRNQPPTVQLSHALHVGAGDHDRRTVGCTGHGECKWRRDAATGQHGIDARQSVGWERLTDFWGYDHVRAVAAKFLVQFGLHVRVEIQRSGSDGRGDNHGKDSGKRSSTSHQRRARQHAHEHLGPRTVASTLYRSTSRRRGHASPRSTTAGSKSMARRMEAALPANVTPMATAIMIGKSTGSNATRELKIQWPICCAMPIPQKNPATPPMSASNPASAKKMAATAPFPAPIAFIK